MNVFWVYMPFNPLTYRSDHHETSPYNPNIIQQIGNENIQTYQLGFILI